MKKFFYTLIATALFFTAEKTFAQAPVEDTTVVQCFTYQSPQTAWFDFPSDTNHYRKILMQYKLHCPDPTQCGEWDYLTYTFLYDHTGKMDSTLFNHSSFMVDNTSPDSVSYMNSPSHSYVASQQYSLYVDSIISSSAVAIGSGSQPSDHPFRTSSDARARTVYLWKASELSVGLSAGNLTSLTLNATFAWGTELNHLKIRMAPTVLDSLETNQLNASWTQVYNYNTYLVTGLNNFQFTQPFSWDGISNVLVEISYDNDDTGWDNMIEVTPETWSAGIFSRDNDRDIFFNANEFIQVPNDAFATLDSFVTVAYWAFGDPATQPNDGTCFEGIAANGQRILNAHCPWSNSNVFWDAGSDGTNYDRINLGASVAQTEGQWNYWTFTKNCVTGVMNIYCNGILFHTGTGMTRLMSGIDYFRIGKGNWGNAQSYRGAMDEFAVWNVELNAATIQQYMNKDIDALHPFYSNLICYYKFNNHNGQTFADSASGNFTATSMGSLDNDFIPAQTLYRNYEKLYERPNITFSADVFNSLIDSIIEIDTIENTAYSIVIFGDTLNPTIATDTIWVYPNMDFTFNIDGTIDTTILTADSTLHKQLWYWHGPAFEIIDQYELARFITLYGNNTTLGANGRTWVYDLTNLAPLLHDSVELSSGNWQEWLDMKFLMIKGTPARDPISVKNLWNGYGYGYDSNTENALTPKTIKIDSTAKNTMWRSITTGHGMNGPQNCAEFCAKYQYGKVNGVQRFDQLIWRDDCGRNPLYPQGGTWVYQRANWCPGAEVWEYNWELTPYVTPGDSETIDLDLEAFSGSGGTFVIASQLISFDLPNFSIDAEMYDILSPNDHDEWSRINPICNEPTVRIRNGGTTPLTSATITYGLEGGPTSTYNWTGNLVFLQKADVTLPSPSWIGNGSNKFWATISNPNGSADGNANNNWAGTHFKPAAYYNMTAATAQKFLLEVKTNAYGYETHYQLRTTGGTILVNRSNLNSNTIYRDTISINPYECYTYEIWDDGEDGLSFWANSAQGSGYNRLKRADIGSILKNFPTDFGAEYIHHFKINFPLDVNEIPKEENYLVVSPDPATTEINVAVQFTHPSNFIEAIVYDLEGRALIQKKIPYTEASEFNFDISKLAAGMYFVKTKCGQQVMTEKFLKVSE